MSDIFQYLASGNSYIETGVIQALLGDNLFSVKINGKTFVIRSAINSALRIGDQVVINVVSNHRYIVGSLNRFKIQKEKEIVING